MPCLFFQVLLNVVSCIIFFYSLLRFWSVIIRWASFIVATFTFRSYITRSANFPKVIYFFIYVALRAPIHIFFKWMASISYPPSDRYIIIFMSQLLALNTLAMDATPCYIEFTDCFIRAAFWTLKQLRIIRMLAFHVANPFLVLYSRRNFCILDIDLEVYHPYSVSATIHARTSVVCICIFSLDFLLFYFCGQFSTNKRHCQNTPCSIPIYQ